jgi:ribonuclease HI
MKIYFDGGCKPNPGQMEVGVVFDGGTSHHDDYGHGTNNKAEWLALIYAMGLAEERGIRDITLIGDSKLVIMQASGKWKCNQPELQFMLAEFQKRRRDFSTVKLAHVRRHLNLAGIYLENR